jgi:hypothetical protein
MKDKHERSKEGNDSGEEQDVVKSLIHVIFSLPLPMGFGSRQSSSRILQSSGYEDTVQTTFPACQHNSGGVNAVKELVLRILPYSSADLRSPGNLCDASGKVY